MSRRDVLARLRKEAAERGDRGGPDSRDSAINTFLDEAETVVCMEVLERAENTTLRALYLTWSRSVLQGDSEDERRRGLISCVLLGSSLWNCAQPEESKVVSLFG